MNPGLFVSVVCGLLLAKPSKQGKPMTQSDSTHSCEAKNVYARPPSRKSPSATPRVPGVNAPTLEQLQQWEREQERPQYNNSWVSNSKES